MGMFYRAVLNGSAAGQDIKNILYYRVGFGIDMSAFDFAGAEALAGAIKAQVWPPMKAWLANNYILETIDVALEPTSILNGIKPPARGYVALGPISSVYVGEDGFFGTSTLQSAAITNIQNALAGNLEVLLPVPTVWFPVRLKQTRILGGLVHWEAFSDVKGCVMSRRASFRRSRMPEL